MVSKEARANNLSLEDHPVHDWYRFVLSFPPHLVRDYLNKFAVNENECVLDPFCGTGTTLVECKKLGISSIGVEANALTCFASTIKLAWSINPDAFVSHAALIADEVRTQLEHEGVNDDGNLVNITLPTDRRTLSKEQWKLMLKDSISPLPLYKTLILIDALSNQHASPYYNHEKLALAKAIVSPISNLRFAPEVSIGSIKADTPILIPWLSNIHAMASNLQSVQHLADVPSVVHHADARQMDDILEPASIDVVITSPPYPNEKDYTRITRLESVMLDFIQDKNELRAMKQNLIRSNTRNVYVTDNDDAWIENFDRIQQLAREIEKRRIELEKDSGFEKLYGKVTKLYFGGMARHLANLRRFLRPGARLAYVVGDQASYLRVMIQTGQIFAEIAEALGYEVMGIDLFRTRISTATREQLREEVVLLRWNG